MRCLLPATCILYSLGSSISVSTRTGYPQGRRVVSTWDRSAVWTWIRDQSCVAVNVLTRTSNELNQTANVQHFHEEIYANGENRHSVAAWRDVGEADSHLAWQHHMSDPSSREYSDIGRSPDHRRRRSRSHTTVHIVGRNIPVGKLRMSFKHN